MSEELKLVSETNFYILIKRFHLPHWSHIRGAFRSDHKFTTTKLNRNGKKQSKIVVDWMTRGKLPH